MLYVAYRWILAIYFSCWIVESWRVANGPLYFAYLTSWAFLTFNAYLVIATISTTVSYLSAHFINPREEREFSREKFGVRHRPSGCFGHADNVLCWYQKLHWLSFTIGSETAFVITLLYWVLLYRGGHVSAISANTHLTNGLVAIADLWVCGLPVHLLHVVYLMLFGALYVVFTGIYFVVSDSVIYTKFLDYEDMLGVAIAVVLCSILLLLPVVHTICFYLQYLARAWLVHCYLQRKDRGKQQELKENEEMQELEENGRDEATSA